MFPHCYTLEIIQWLLLFLFGSVTNFLLVGGYDKCSEASTSFIASRHFLKLDH